MIRYCKTRDDVSIAFSVEGKGPPLVLVGGSANIEDRPSVFDAYRVAYRRFHTVIRYCMRGSGLSDRPDVDYALDDYVLDLEAVVDAIGLKRFDLFGETTGGCVAIAYAARHPGRVAHLAVLGTPARSLAARNPRPQVVELRKAMVDAMRAGWDHGPEAFRQIWISQMAPGASRQQIRDLCEVYAATFRGVDAVRFVEATSNMDVSFMAARVSCPVLVAHSRCDALIPFDEARMLAGLIPGAQLFPFDSPNRFPLPDEPAFDALHSELQRHFSSAAPQGGDGSEFETLSMRDRRILDLIAQGLDNHQIAARLDRSEKTIRNAVSAILDAVGAESRAQLIIRSRAEGFGLNGHDLSR
jgi:pimeloyl-ACP methyl ester carboxylesterase/DNA-binding CsgD family transcriptional regulator